MTFELGGKEELAESLELRQESTVSKMLSNLNLAKYIGKKRIWNYKSPDYKG